MKIQKEANADTGEESPKLKKGFSHSESNSGSNEAPGEEISGETEKETPVEQEKKNLSLIFPYLKRLSSFSKLIGWTSQAKTVYRVHSGKDVTAPAQTRTEKTFFFAIPLTENLQRGLQDRKRGCDPQGQGPAFTRELANQISKDSSDITKSYLCLGFRVVNSNKYRVGLISWLGPQVALKTTCTVAS